MDVVGYTNFGRLEFDIVYHNRYSIRIKQFGKYILKWYVPYFIDKYFVT